MHGMMYLLNFFLHNLIAPIIYLFGIQNMVSLFFFHFNSNREQCHTHDLSSTREHSTNIAAMMTLSVFKYFVLLQSFHTLNCVIVKTRFSETGLPLFLHLTNYAPKCNSLCI